MSVYVQINSEEEKLLKKTVLEAQAVAVSSQNTCFILTKQKKSKATSMTGTATAMKEIEKELKKIKQALPELELVHEKKPAKQTTNIKKARTKYEQELEAIKEKISKLG